MENYKLLMHSWGTSPAQKRKEAEYNHKYYEEHKEKWKKLHSKTNATYEKADKNTGDTSIYFEERKAKKLQMYKDPYKGLYDGNPYEATVDSYKKMTEISNKIDSLQKQLYDGMKAERKLRSETVDIKELGNRIKELENSKVRPEDLLSEEDARHPAIVAQMEPVARKKNQQIDKEIEAVKKQIRDNDSKLGELNDVISYNNKIRKELENTKKTYGSTKKDYELADEAAKKGMSVGRLKYEKQFEKNLRNKKASDAKAANEASKAEANRTARLDRLTKAEKTKQSMDVYRKQAKRAATRREMLSYQAQLDREKYAPLNEKARKFVDGTVEVAMDNAKNTLSKLKPNKPAQSVEDKKKKVNRGKAWVFKNLGIELF